MNEKIAETIEEKSFKQRTYWVVKQRKQENESEEKSFSNGIAI